MGKLRKRLTDLEAKKLGLSLNKKLEGRRKAEYKITKKQWQQVQNFVFEANERQFFETQLKKDKNGNVISTVEKLQAEPLEVPENFEVVKISTSQSTGQQWVQYQPKKEEFSEETIDFEAIIKKHIKPIDKIVEPLKETEFIFDRLVYTDLHIGMNPNENGHSLYGGKWDEPEIENTLDELVKLAVINQKSNVIIIDELGDFMDGWDGETVRKGHSLPQNMDNEKAFDVGVSFKVRMIDKLVNYYDKIICHNICNDNHAGSFAYVVNQAFKGIAELKYNSVEVINYRGFIEHYEYGNNTFILSHGKDGKNLKFGFKPILDAKQETKISNYIDENFLFKKGTVIEFSKGDSHQDLFDNSTSDKFNYYNYPALSPSSEWVQTNFKRGVRGLYFFNYRQDGTKIIIPKYFKWEKV